MEPQRDARFDPNYATQLLLEIAHEQSVEALLQRVVRTASERPSLACLQVWLIKRGEACSPCPVRPPCTDNRCLHLVAGGGVSVNPGSVSNARFADTSARIPLGLGFVGRAAATGKQEFVRNLDESSEEIFGFEWLKAERIRSCGATPILFKGEVLGVITGFSRQEMPEESRPWGRIFADHIGAALANARAFEEIQRLKAQLELHNTYLQQEVVEARAFGDLVGRSGALGQIISQIDLVAPTEASVLILGETGTGKELVAREIHRRSNRREGPLVRVNCASIPEELFESEFFGHVQGAFTGAVKDRAGRFEAAAGGTLFLDEIGEIPIEMQSKLLRVLQEKHYERVGEDRTRAADVRIIGATNRDLKKALASGKLREDLYYRLHVFPIQVPPLRDRKEDIPLLAEHFIRISVKDLKCPNPRLTRAAVTRLQAYDWPGNVRELRNVIERAVILARGGTLCVDLPISAPRSPASITPTPPASNGGDAVYLTEAELEHRSLENLLTVLNLTGWRIKGSGGAAELLGIKPTTLLARMKKAGLRKPVE